MRAGIMLLPLDCVNGRESFRFWPAGERDVVRRHQDSPAIEQGRDGPGALTALTRASFSMPFGATPELPHATTALRERPLRHRGPRFETVRTVEASSLAGARYRMRFPLRPAEESRHRQEHARRRSTKPALPFMNAETARVERDKGRVLHVSTCGWRRGWDSDHCLALKAKT